MTIVTPNLPNIEPVQLAKRDSKSRPSPAFKEMINKKRSSTQEEEDRCTISVFELPRSHFIDNEEEAEAGMIAPPLALSQSMTTEALLLQPAQLQAEIDALFEKMASAMIVLSSSGETETTVFLDTPQFNGSLFYGSSITIKEFSTAPKTFNVEILSSALALQTIDAYKTALLATFAKGDFNFSIHRLDTGIHREESPLFHRKEAVSQDEEDRSQ